MQCIEERGRYLFCVTVTLWAKALQNCVVYAEINEEACSLLSRRLFFKLLAVSSVATAAYHWWNQFTGVCITWSTHNMGWSYFRAFSRVLAFIEDNCNKQVEYYSATVYCLLFLGETCHIFCLPPFPIANKVCTTGTEVLPLASLCRQQRCFCCHRILLEDYRGFWRMHDKETSFFLLPAVLPPAWI